MTYIRYASRRLSLQSYSFIRALVSLQLVFPSGLVRIAFDKTEPLGQPVSYQLRADAPDLVQGRTRNDDINAGMIASMVSFPFSGWKESSSMCHSSTP